MKVLFKMTGLESWSMQMPLSICNGDGTRRRTNKSKVKEVLLIGVGSLEKNSFGFFSKRCFIGGSYSPNQHSGF